MVERHRGCSALRILSPYGRVRLGPYTTMPASSTTAAARRIFHITDWAPAHKALYPGAENDSSIDTLPFPTKPGESSSSASNPSSSVAPPVRRMSTKKTRSMSVPWRPKSVVIPVVSPVDDLDQRLGDLALHRSRTTADAVDSASPTTPGFGNWSGFGVADQDQEQEPNSHADSGMIGKGKGKKSISGMWRRASVSIKTLVNRRTSIATETLNGSPNIHLHLQHHNDQKRQLRSSHAPSRSHHTFTTNSQNAQASSGASPSSPATLSPNISPRATTHIQQQQQQQSPRSPTSHAINSRWHRLRKATSTSFRNSRVLNGDFALSSHDNAYIPTEELPQSVPRPGFGNEPPIIPRNSGSGARAAVAAWQNEMFPMPFKNKRLTLDSTQNDRESGIGIAVTSTDSVADELQDPDIVTAEGDVVLGACAPSRVDFVYRLPVELAIQVLAHLDAASLAPASRVSKAWRNVTSLQHIWRESYLREKTGTYATSEPIQPGAGLGVPAIQPNMNWKDAYAATEELSKRWKQGKATSVWMNGHSDSIYCLQFDE